VNGTAAAQVPKVSLEPWKSPFNDAQRYRVWLQAHPHLMRWARRALVGRALPRQSWPVDVLEVFANDGGLSEEPVFVYGSNLAGRNGRGAAYFAAQWCGAAEGVGEGMTGQAYALPTKTASWGVRSTAEIGESAQRFLRHASDHPAVGFRVSRVGCGLARYKDEDIAPLFRGASDNVDLPYRWRVLLGEDLPPRVIVAGSRDFTEQGRLDSHLDRLLSRLDEAVIISGGAAGADRMGEAYGMARWGVRPVPFLRYPAEWDHFGKPAGMIRNQEMARVSSHLVAFWDGKSPGTRTMIKVAEDDGLNVRVIRV